MLAESGTVNLLVFAVIMIAMVVGRVVEYLRKKKGEQDAKERRLRGARTEGREREAAGPGVVGGDDEERDGRSRRGGSDQPSQQLTAGQPPTVCAEGRLKRRLWMSGVVHTAPRG